MVRMKSDPYKDAKKGHTQGNRALPKVRHGPAEHDVLAYRKSAGLLPGTAPVTTTNFRSFVIPRGHTILI